MMTWMMIKHSWKAFPAMLLLVIVSVFVAFFSLNILFTLSWKVHLSQQAEVPFYTTITIVPEAGESFNGRALIDYCDQHQIPVKTAFFFDQSVDEDGTLYFVSGYYGNGNGESWIAYDTGTFFADLEENQLYNYAYVGNYYYKRLGYPDHVKLRGQDFSVIGTGLMVSVNFRSLMTPEARSKQQIFQSKNYSSEPEYTVIIPFRAFEECQYNAQVVFLHTGIYLTKLPAVVNELQAEFPNVHISQHHDGSNEELILGLERILPLGGIPILLVMLSFVSVYSLFLDYLVKILHIYHILGVSQKKNKGIILQLTGGILLAGLVLGYGVHYLLRPVLVPLNLETIPPLAFAVAEYIVVYLLVRVFNRKRINAVLYEQKAGIE